MFKTLKDILRLDVLAKIEKQGYIDVEVIGSIHAYIHQQADELKLDIYDQKCK
jgi:hypothetical protein